MDQLLLFVSTHKSILSVSPCVREVRSERSDSCVVSKQELAAVLKNLKPKMQLAHKKSMHCWESLYCQTPIFCNIRNMFTSSCVSCRKQWSIRWSQSCASKARKTKKIFTWRNWNNSVQMMDVVFILNRGRIAIVLFCLYSDKRSTFSQYYLYFIIVDLTLLWTFSVFV